MYKKTVLVFMSEKMLYDNNILFICFIKVKIQSNKKRWIHFYSTAKTRDYFKSN